METISIPLSGRPNPSSATKSFFERKGPLSDASRIESDLLTSIRTALRGYRGEAGTAPHTLYYPSRDANGGEEELSWDTYNLVLSFGGVIRRRWSFKDDEKQPIQWACIGYVEQPSTVHTASLRPDLATGDAQHSGPDPSSPSPSSTFGPFAHVQREPKSDEEPATRSRAVFIFLRSLARVYLIGNGQEHTFYLPFVVRRAWPLFPHGIMLQRILDPAEVEEARESGDAPLPTLFTIINPHAEPAILGLSSSIVGGFDGTAPALHDDMGNRALTSVPAEEMVLWTGPRSADIPDHTMVTLDSEQRRISLWRYAYIPSKDLPDSPMAAPRSPISARHSQQPSLAQSVSSLPPNSPGYAAFPHRAPDTVSLAALPGMPPALTTTTTMASLMHQGGSIDPNVSHPSVGAVKSGRPSLGGSGPMPPPRDDIDYGLDALGDSRMKADYWVEKLWSEEISEAE